VWRPAFFCVKPSLIIKGGFITHGAMGDERVDPHAAAIVFVCLARSGAVTRGSLTFVSQTGLNGHQRQLRTGQTLAR
jgi:urease subunit alpha